MPKSFSQLSFFFSPLLRRQQRVERKNFSIFNLLEKPIDGGGILREGISACHKLMIHGTNLFLFLALALLLERDAGKKQFLN
jgi:hypothetical protein